MDDIKIIVADRVDGRAAAFLTRGAVVALEGQEGLWVVIGFDVQRNGYIAIPTDVAIARVSQEAVEAGAVTLVAEAPL